MLMSLEKMVDSKQLFNVNRFLTLFMLILMAFYQLHIDLIRFKP